MKDSTIRVNAEREGGSTVLKESYHNAPYKVRHFGAAQTKKHLEMIIMSSSPGIMDGDKLLIDVQVRKAAELKLVTQSYNKLHPMRLGATQYTKAQLEEDSIFYYVPHPLTPFKDSIFKTTNEFHLADDATLIFGDIIGAGRIFMDEAFVFTKLHTVTDIYRNGKLIYKDNQCLLPQEQPLQDILFFEGHTHQGAFIYSGPFADAMKVEMDEILTVEYEDVEFGFTQCAQNTILLRAVADNGELLYNFFNTLAQMCWVFTKAQKTTKDEQGDDTPPVTLEEVENFPQNETASSANGQKQEKATKEKKKDGAKVASKKTAAKKKAAPKSKKTAGKAVKQETANKTAVS